MTKLSQVGIYARVSTDDCRQDTEVQLVPLRAFCQQRGFAVSGEYVDHMSGSKDDRPGLANLMGDARRRKLDAVVVWKFDRFARSTRALVLALEEFQALGVEFISMSENIDTTTPMGKAMFTVISAMAPISSSVMTAPIA